MGRKARPLVSETDPIVLRAQLLAKTRHCDRLKIERDEANAEVERLTTKVYEASHAQAALSEQLDAANARADRLQEVIDTMASEALAVYKPELDAKDAEIERLLKCGVQQQSQIERLQLDRTTDLMRISALTTVLSLTEERAQHLGNECMAWRSSATTCGDSPCWDNPLVKECRALNDKLGYTPKTSSTTE